MYLSVLLQFSTELDLIAPRVENYLCLMTTLKTVKKSNNITVLQYRLNISSIFYWTFDSDWHPSPYMGY